ncbi:hypothetical protein ACIQ7S_11890 [Streptomyces griseoluteus]|uniref:hypothetical protein n=1 Tax=Streptomyces griseoluteus TaxID=29306 RepID=UPI00332CBA7D
MIELDAAVRAAVDDPHEEVRAALTERGRFTPCTGCAGGAHAGARPGQRLDDGPGQGNAPEELVEVVTGELVAPADPVVAVRTIRTA